ncbi:hypothetical protein IGI04_039572 [Brassica rapa subsp. trilocularis]|uniref:O-methyltransferase domain-containing protein n=1 Tax=Brassica rapa subsp. trilocularis TaxID=1813537 RepID=A0ABQ7KPC8_BRACM|nr:hypothetical protein IGI04_039572 [Brassica rapa subsp. trilocularis]
MGSTAETHSTPVQVTDDETALFAIQLASASVLPMALKSAIELDLLEIMARNCSPMSASEISSHLPTKNPEAPVMLDRILRLLTAYSVLTCSVRTLPDGVDRLYGLGPVCKYFIKNEDGVSIAPLCLLNHDKDAVLDGGIPFNKAYGMSAFEYHGTDLRFNKVFNNGMSNHSTITMKKILETYNGFEGLVSLVDVGGGIGATLKMIVSKYPNLKGINFDLPHVIEDAPSHPGVEHVGGDMFVSVPKECILPETLDSSLSTKQVVNVDCIMLALNPGGKERTEKEYEALAKGSGFEGIKVVCNVFGVHVIELLKKI